MTPGASLYRQPVPRGQAQRLAGLLSREGSRLHAAVCGRRREGKSDLLWQVRALLFERGEGPVPIHYAFDSTRPAESLARHFAASVCQQIRAFLLRQEEFLREPLPRLEQEVERPGLPLSLTELAREFLALATAEQPEAAAALAERFAEREGRPVCLLFDNAEALAPNSPFLPALQRIAFPWLLTGRKSTVARMAGQHGWTLAPLEPFSVEDALLLAERKCREYDLRFSREAWEHWLDYAGSSPGWIGLLVESAAVRGIPLESVAALGKLYAGELAAGGLGGWLAERWERALPAVQDRPTMAERLVTLAQGHAGPVASVPHAAREGMVSEEWLEEMPAGPVARLGQIEQDWLAFVGSAEGAASPQMVEGRILQAFLQRVQLAHASRPLSEAAERVKEAILAQPQPDRAGAERSVLGSAGLGAICSVAVEGPPTAQLLWCYGLRAGRSGRAPIAGLLLVVLCGEEPPAAEVKQWSQRLREESGQLSGTGTAESRSTGPGSRSELWLALPPGASLAPVGEERRMHWETLLQLVGEQGDLVASFESEPGAAATPASRLHAGEGELEARAQWLEEELASVSDQLQRELRNASNGPSSRAKATQAASAADRGESNWRTALALGLLRMSSDLLAMQQHGNLSQLGALREIQSQSQKLLELLRALEEAKVEDPKQAKKPPAPPAK